MNTRIRRWTGLRPPLVWLCLVVTGVAGLAYEIAWQRHLTILVGADHAASAVTLALFLAGLALGYALCGRLSANSRSPLRVYILLEAGIGAWGLLFPWLFGVVSAWAANWSFRPPWEMVGGAVASAAMLILLPAILMGATVPFMTRMLSADREGMTGTHAWVYGVHTAGALVGALLTGLYLLPALGPDVVVRLAATLNLSVALILGLAFFRTSLPQPRRIARPPRPELPTISPSLLVLLAVGSGWVTLLQENVILRLLAPTVGATPQLFCVVVAAFVGAIALGSLWVSRLATITRSTLSRCCAFATVASLILFISIDKWPWVAHVVRVRWFSVDAAGEVAQSSALFLISVWALLFLALLASAAPLGAVLPLIFHECATEPRRSGATAGSLLGWNAIGSIGGSLFGGLFLYHWFDLDRVMLFAPLMLALMTMAASWRLAPRLRLGSLLLPLVVFAFFVWTPGFDRQRLAIGGFLVRQPTAATAEGPAAFAQERIGSGSVTFHRDGPTASVAVVRYATSASVFVNGRSESNTHSDRETIRLAAHIPMLLAERPRRALVVGQGTGVTLGELARWDRLEQLELVELSETVVQTLPRLGEFTSDVHLDPRLTVRVEDARHLLRHAEAPWDLIVSEPSNPWIAGMDLLFSIEWFQSVEQSLAPGGVFLQWLQIYDTDEAIFCSILRSMNEVFPEMRAFRGSPSDWLIVGMRARSELEIGSWPLPPRVAESLKQLEIDSPEDVASREVRLFPLLLERYREECPIHHARETDLAYRAAEAMYRGSSLFEPNLFSPR